MGCNSSVEGAVSCLAPLKVPLVHPFKDGFPAGGDRMAGEGLRSRKPLKAWFYGLIEGPCNRAGPVSEVQGPARGIVAAPLTARGASGVDVCLGTVGRYSGAD